MPFKKIEDEVLACAFNKIDNRKTRKIFHEENLENIKRERDKIKKYTKRQKTRKTSDFRKIKKKVRTKKKAY